VASVFLAELFADFLTLAAARAIGENETDSAIAKLGVPGYVTQARSVFVVRANSRRAWAGEWQPA